MGNNVLGCKRCVNTTKNPNVRINHEGYCNVCEVFMNNFNKSVLETELSFLRSRRGKGKTKYDAFLGLSGGKDSTATLYTVKQMGFRPLAFTFDLGYYPKHIFQRAKHISSLMDTDHQIIDIRRYIRASDVSCYQKTAALYDETESDELKERFINIYKDGKKHYSIKCRHFVPVVRTCQLCRRPVIRAYYSEAIKRGINLIILGMNGWANLSGTHGLSKKVKISAIKILKPYKNSMPVYVVHLPFLLQRSIKETQKILDKAGWKEPKGENLIETNANSCLFARAAESKAKRMLGFHPDTPRLAREVTVGFITKVQAKIALEKIHRPVCSVRHVLERANII